MLHRHHATLLATCFTSTLACASQEPTQKPINASLMFDEMEYRWHEEGDDPVSWSIAATINRGKHSLWLVSEGDHTFGDIGGHELLGFYSYATDSGWNLNAGWRGDSKPKPDKDWALLGIDGQLPGSVAIAGTAYFSAGGDSAFRLEMERTFTPAKNWYLTPEMRADFYGQDMPASGRGSGLSTLEFAARLGYQWNDNFATYMGAIWGKAYGTTGEYVAAEGDDSTTTQYLMGISLSF